MSTRCAVCPRKDWVASGVSPESSTWVIPRDRGFADRAGSFRNVGHSGTARLRLWWCGRTIGTPLAKFRCPGGVRFGVFVDPRSEEHTSELQSLRHLVCRLLLEKKKIK